MDVEKKAEPQTAPLKTYMTAEEASAFIGVAVQTLAKWRHLGGVGPTFIKVSSGTRGRVMYAVDDLTAWMTARRATSTSEVAARAAA